VEERSDGARRGRAIPASASSPNAALFGARRFDSLERDTGTIHGDSSSNFGS
jgi:hypothetical protein